MSRARRALATALVACAALAATTASAAATFHLVQIREVYPGSSANPGSEYVVLQAWAPDQNHVAGHFVRGYDAAGGTTGSDSFPQDLPRGSDQATMTLATPEAEAEFGFVADAPLAPSGLLDPAAGAICWETLDCVSWGSFSGSLPSPAGSPAGGQGGVPDGMALRRTIAPGCATLLEPGDDHDSGADFSAVFPTPRPNSTIPTERPCEAQSGAGTGTGPSSSGHRDAPNTVLRHTPAKRSRDRTPSFRFGADESGANFECRIDSRPFRPCRSPFTALRLGVGRHAFSVRAGDDSGAVDPSPASYRFRVLPPTR